MEDNKLNLERRIHIKHFSVENGVFYFQCEFGTKKAGQFQDF